MKFIFFKALVIVFLGIIMPPCACTSENLNAQPQRPYKILQTETIEIEGKKYVLEKIDQIDFNVPKG